MPDRALRLGHRVCEISRDEVARLAKLARLALTDQELESFAGQLDAILDHVSQVQAVDVTDVTPTGNPLKDVNVTRPDVVDPCLTQAEALAEAPSAVDGRFAVPQILGTSSEQRRGAPGRRDPRAQGSPPGSCPRSR